eukprot:jgi/Mesvir1/23779/Mv25225-RA.1
MATLTPHEERLAAPPSPDPQLFHEVLPGRWVSRSCFPGGSVHAALPPDRAALVRTALCGISWHASDPLGQHLAVHSFDDAGRCVLGCGSRCPALAQIEAVLQGPRIFSYLSTPDGRARLRDIFPWLPAEGDAELDDAPCDL